MADITPRIVLTALQGSIASITDSGMKELLDGASREIDDGPVMAGKMEKGFSFRDACALIREAFCHQLETLRNDQRIADDKRDAALSWVDSQLA